MIVLTCSRCSKKLQVNDEAAGKQAQCPHCGQVLLIPAQATLAHSNPSKLSSQPEPVPVEKSKPDSSQEATVGESPGALAAGDTLSPHPGAPGGDAGKELYDFLAPPRGAGEIGWLGPYRVLNVLGAGGMGVVFQAEDPHLERKVALKAMRPALITSDSAKKRFLREAKTTASIKHDHIVTIFQVGEDRGAPFLAMEFLEGESLDDRMKREKRLPVAEVLRIGREIAEGLAAAHEHGLIHRDIKPGNLWLEGKRGRVKVLDFGLARAAGDETHLTQTGAIVGTPAYMAPEQAHGEAVDARCDLFSLGCVLYRVGTGELPFKGRDTMSVLLALTQDQPRPPGELNAELPPALSELILKLLAKKRDERPPSAEAVVAAIQAIENDQTVRLTSPHSSVKRPNRATAPRPLRRKLPLVIAAAVVLAVVLLLGAIITLKTRHGSLVVKVTEPDVQVLVDGQEKLVIDSKKVGRLELVPGEHKLIVRRGEEELYTESFTLKSGGEVVIDAIWIPKAPPPDETWFKTVAALKAEEQVEAVAAKLKELNPGFDGVVTPTIVGGVVTQLALPADHVTDLSPVRALPRLNLLFCRADEVGKGNLSDLSPLKGMRLTALNCA